MSKKDQRSYASTNHNSIRTGTFHSPYRPDTEAFAPHRAQVLGAGPTASR